MKEIKNIFSKHRPQEDYHQGCGNTLSKTKLVSKGCFETFHNLDYLPWRCYEAANATLSPQFVPAADFNLAYPNYLDDSQQKIPQKNYFDDFEH